MKSNDGRYIITFNGKYLIIKNKFLIKKGYSRNKIHTEVILALLIVLVFAVCNISMVCFHLQFGILKRANF